MEAEDAQLPPEQLCATSVRALMVVTIEIRASSRIAAALGHPRELHKGPRRPRGAPFTRLPPEVRLADGEVFALPRLFHLKVRDGIHRNGTHKNEEWLECSPLPTSSGLWGRVVEATSIAAITWRVLTVSTPYGYVAHLSLALLFYF